MTWVRLDEGMPEHPKVAQLSDAAFRLHVEGLCYCNRNLTDGFVPTVVAHRRGKRRAVELVAVGVWDEAPGGYQVHDFHDYQPSKAEVLDLREKRSSAGRAGAGKRWGKSDGKPVAKPMASAIASDMANGWQNDAPIPNPIPEQSLALLNLQSQGGREPRLLVNDRKINPGTGASIERLLERLPDATSGTVGRLVNLAKAGASQADFEDARDQIGELRPDHPSRLACHIVQKRLAEREATA